MLVSQLSNQQDKFARPNYETIVFVDLDPPSESKWTIYTLTLQNGRSICVTHDHKVPILAENSLIEEKRADQLVRGEQLA